jgi:hypothetical protein
MILFETGTMALLARPVGGHRPAAITSKAGR